MYSDKGVNAESRVSRIDGCGGFDFDGVNKNISKLKCFSLIMHDSSDAADNRCINFVFSFTFFVLS